jgi:MFS family permease
LNQLAVIAATQGIAMAAAIVMSMRITADVPLAPTSQGERFRSWAIIAACCAGMSLLTAAMFHAGWPYKTHLLTALGVAGLLYLPFSTSSESDEDDSPVSIIDWVKVTLAVVACAASLAAIGAYAVLLKL